MPENIREEYLVYLDSLREQNEPVFSVRPKLITEFGMEPDAANEVFHFWMGERNLAGHIIND